MTISPLPPEKPDLHATRNCPDIVKIYDFLTAQKIATKGSFSSPDMAGYLTLLQKETGYDLSPSIRVANNAPFFMEGSRHIAVRKMALNFLSSRRLADWIPMIDAFINQSLECMESIEQPDLVRDFSDPLFISVTSHLLGLRPNKAEHFQSHASQLQLILEPMLALPKILKLNEVLRNLLQSISEQPAAPTDNANPIALLDQLLLTPPNDFDQEDCAALVLVLYGASINVSQTLSNVLFDLLSSDQTIKTAASQDSWVEEHIEELIRRNASPMYLHRIPKVDQNINHCSFVAGDNVLIHLPSVNHDTTQFPKELTNDVNCSVNRKDGKQTGHLAFGSGMHGCLGASYSRLLIKRAVPKLLTRFPHLVLKVKQPEYHNNTQATAIVALPIELQSTEDLL